MKTNQTSFKQKPSWKTALKKTNSSKQAFLGREFQSRGGYNTENALSLVTTNLSSFKGGIQKKALIQRS